MTGHLQSLFRPAGVQAKAHFSKLEAALDLIAKGVSGRFYRGNASAQLDMNLVESEAELEAKRNALISRRVKPAA